MIKIHPHLAPAANELVVVKRRVSAFTGSDLEVILRAQQIQHIVLTGIDTSGVVLSTLREAADKDYRITVLADCCGDADKEVHRVLTTKVFVSQAEVMTLADWNKK
jgi:nicotinamidase-related amidase